MRVLLLVGFLSLWTSVARAHGPSGSHDSPQWCGMHLAMLADGGVLIDGKLVKVGEKEALIAWSPACDQLAVVGKEAHLIDPATNTVRDLGALPGKFERGMRMEGPAPSIRFSPSGKRFAVVGVSETIDHMSIVRYDVASGKGVVLRLFGEVNAFALLDDDRAVAVYRALRAPDSQLVRVDEKGVTPLVQGKFKDARISVAPIVVGLFSETKALSVFDPVTGIETKLPPAIEYLQAMSDDGSHALAVIGQSSSTIDMAGTVTKFDPSAMYGLISDEQTGWSADGTLAITRAGKTWSILAAGKPVVAWRGIPKGDIGHASIAKDGKRAAFVIEVPAPAIPGARRCDYNDFTYAVLYTADIAPASRAKKVATLAHIHHCGIE